MSKTTDDERRRGAPVWARSAWERGSSGSKALALALGLGGCAGGGSEMDAVNGYGTAQGAPMQASPITREPYTPAVGAAVEPAGPAPAPVTASPYPAAASPEDVEMTIAEHLDRLDRLAIAEVAGLVMELPSEAAACYGGPPCAGHESVYEQERARQAARLSGLAVIADEVAQDGSLAPAAYATAEQALQALRALRIVDVTALVHSEAQNNPACYSLPCPEDIARAEAENGLRVAQALAIAEAAEREGL